MSDTERATTTTDEITQKLDLLVRLVEDNEGRFERCRTEANLLAAAVYDFVKDEVYGTAEVRAAYERFMQHNAGNFGAAPAAPSGQTGCGECLTCDPPQGLMSRFYVCATCGNKRCPAAGDCRYECSGSNELGQMPRFRPVAPSDGSAS